MLPSCVFNISWNELRQLLHLQCCCCCCRCCISRIALCASERQTKKQKESNEKKTLHLGDLSIKHNTHIIIHKTLSYFNNKTHSILSAVCAVSCKLRQYKKVNSLILLFLSSSLCEMKKYVETQKSIYCRSCFLLFFFVFLQFQKEKGTFTVQY